MNLKRIEFDEIHPIKGCWYSIFRDTNFLRVYQRSGLLASIHEDFLLNIFAINKKELIGNPTAGML